MNKFTAKAALELADENGEVMWGGRVAGRVKPLDVPVRAVVADAGRGIIAFTLTGNGKVEKMRGGTGVYVGPVESVKAQGKIWGSVMGEPLFFHAFPERGAACDGTIAPCPEEGFVTLPEIEEWEDARVCETCLTTVGQSTEREGLAEAPQDTDDVEVTAQDVADAALSGECEWTDEQVADAAAQADAPAASAKLPGKPPANFIDLARTGNTPQARAYWTRRCQDWADYKG
jgi:hypothetical protein